MCERTENLADRSKCAEFGGELARTAGVAVLTDPAQCSLAPPKWLPTPHRFRTLRVSLSENQGLS